MMLSAWLESAILVPELGCVWSFAMCIFENIYYVSNCIILDIVTGDYMYVDDRGPSVARRYITSRNTYVCPLTTQRVSIIIFGAFYRVITSRNNIDIPISAPCRDLIIICVKAISEEVVMVMMLSERTTVTIIHVRMI